MRPIEIEVGKWVVDYGKGPFYYPETITLQEVPRYLDPAAGTVIIIAALVGIILLALLVSRLEDKRRTEQWQSLRRHQWDNRNLAKRGRRVG